MPIPCEVFGSIPRPLKLQRAFAAYEARQITFEQLEPEINAACEGTIRRMEDAGQLDITDGEQRISSFATYPIFDTLRGTGLAENLVDDGHGQFFAIPAIVMHGQIGHGIPSLPLDVKYIPADLAAAKPFLVRPVYYVDGRARSIVCWSSSTITQSTSYLWHVYLCETYQWMIRFQGAIYHGSNFISSGGYYFHVLDTGHRLLLQLIKPNDDLKLVDLHADPDVALGEFCRSGGLGCEMLYYQPPIPPMYALPSAYVGLGVVHSQQATDSVQSRLDRYLPLNPIANPELPLSDSPSHANQANSPTIVVSGEGAFVPSMTYNGAPSPADVGGVEAVVMNVPELTHTHEAVMGFVEEFVKNLDRGVRSVVCSMCNGDKRNKLWEAKRSSLRRHLFSHLGIKSFSCSECTKCFTTKHQLKMHSKRRHKLLGAPWPEAPT